MSIFNEIGKNGLSRFINRASKYAPMNNSRIFTLCLNWKDRAKGKPVRDIKEPEELEKRWVESVKRGNPDYSVYGSPYYFCDIWICWEIYSRYYLKLLDKTLKGEYFKPLPFKRGDIKSVLDMGCGIGYTTAGLKEIFPHATVIGTNLEGTSQYKMGSDLGRQYGFRVVGERGYKGSAFDLVFASEFFEHIIEPISLLNDVLRESRPKYLLLASTFNVPNHLGHFPRYLHEGSYYDGKTISKMFDNALKEKGYQKHKTGWWNSRPTLWIKK
jgi:SAM-dependent methyltransferase